MVHPIQHMAFLANQRMEGFMKPFLFLKNLAKIQTEKINHCQQCTGF